MTLLAGKVAIVTGAGSGVGRGVAIALARNGAQVVASSRTVSKCETAVDDIEAAGGTAIAVECDVTQPEQVAACVARAVDAYGGIDVLVNAADDPRVDVPFLELTDEVMNASWEAGVLGTQADRLGGQEQHRKLGRQQRHGGGNDAVDQRRIDAQRQVRAMLLGRAEREHGDARGRVERGEVPRRELGPETAAKGRHSGILGLVRK